MELLYTLFVLPIELLYGFIYFVCVKLTNNYGIGLFVLSCISAIAFLPIAKLAESQQNAENEDRSILAPQLALIKEKYSGKEKNDAIKRLYNRYSYHPIKSIRSAFGVLLQLPFLAGAYYMISSLEDIQGQPFLCISDLSQPDGLLFGLNLLPVVMTIINVAVIFTAKGLERKDIVQALTIAAFFLVLLYPAPSALLIFWTMNNILFLLQNIAPNHLHKQQSKKQQATKFHKLFFPSISLNEANMHNKIYFLSLLCLVFIIFFYLPVNLYTSDIDFFDTTLFQIFKGITPYAFLVLFGFTLLWFVFDSLLAKKLMSFTAVFLFIFAVTNMFIVVRNFGALDHGILSNATKLLSPTVFFRDFGANFLASLLLTSLFLYKKIRRYCPQLIFLLTLPLIIVFGFNITLKSTIKNDFFVTDEAKVFSEIQSYSKDEKNVVIFFLDMFTGGHIEKMIDDPWFTDFKTGMDGFTWYPDATSPGWCTIVGSATIYGGAQFTPLNINSMNTPIMEAYHQAIAVLPRNFSKNGYTTHLVEGFKPFNKDLLLKYDALNENTSYVQGVDYEKLHNKSFHFKLNPQKNIPFMLTVSLYTVSPSYIKKLIYLNNWFDTYDTQNNIRSERLSQLYSFLNIGINNKSQLGTLKIFYSLLPHLPWNIDSHELKLVIDPYPETEGQLTFIDDIIPEHYYTERHIMKMMMDYIELLKENGVYDNTKIILVSDHCEADSQMLAALFPNRPTLPFEFGSKEHEVFTFGRPHALLMVKDFNQHGPMKTDNAIMCNSDVPMIAGSHLNTFDAFERFDPYQRTENDIRTHVVTNSWRLEDQHEKEFVLKKAWLITGTMFDRSHWKEMNIEDAQTYIKEK